METDVIFDPDNSSGFAFAFSTQDAAAAPDADETVDGVIAARSPRHQRILLRLAVPLATLVDERKAGLVYVAPVDVVVEQSPRRVCRPDLFYVSQARMLGDEEPEGALDVGPDLIVEVFSHGETRRAFAATLTDYTRIGVSEVWLVSPQSETIEVLRATPEGYETAGLNGSGDTAASEVLPGYAVALDSIFD